MHNEADLKNIFRVIWVDLLPFSISLDMEHPNYTDISCLFSTSLVDSKYTN